MNIAGTNKVPTRGGTLVLTGTFPDPLTVQVRGQTVTPLSKTSSEVQIAIDAGGNYSVLAVAGSMDCMATSSSTWSYLLINVLLLINFGFDLLGMPILLFPT